MTDQDIIPLLRRLKAPTFFTYDEDYRHPRLCHPSYCLVHLDINVELTAMTIRQFLRHRTLRTWNQRKGTMVWIRPAGMRVWRWKEPQAEDIPW
jgi:hypothetical protein